MQTVPSAAQLQEMIEQAKAAAKDASERYFKDELGGKDSMPCGFAWVKIVGFNGERIRGNTKIGKALKAAGIEDNTLWNPSGHPSQNIDTKYAGAKVAAVVLRRYGFDAHADSRWD